MPGERRTSPVDRRAEPPDPAPTTTINGELIMYRLDQQDQVLARILEQTHKTNGRVTALEMKDAEQSGRRAGSGATTDWQLKLIAAFVGVAALATGIIPLVTK